MYQFAAAVAAALNPLLASLPGAVRLALERWADETAAERVGSRTRVAAALGHGIGGYVVGSADDGSTPSGQFVAMSSVQPDIMTASLRVEKKDWGTRLDWNCHYLATGGYSASRVYELVITDTSGRQTIAATWVATSPKTASLSTTSAVPKDSIKSVEIRVAGSPEPLTETEL